MRLVPGLLLLLFAATASAEWLKVHDNEEAASYVDPPTIRTEGEVRRVWRLQDLKKPGAKGERSIRALLFYDCKGERQRIVTFTFHSGQMAKGKTLVNQAASGDWAHVAPNTAAASVMQFVCGR